MLVVSFALHLCLAAGLGLAYLHFPDVARKAPVQRVAPLLTIVRAPGNPVAHLTRPVASITPPLPEMPAAVPVIPPAHFNSVVIKSVPAKVPANALALEANPNAHVRALPPDSLLSPTPAPKLDGRGGIVFILDISGSMYEAYAGATRLAFARAELSRRIRALENGTPFAIVFYAERAQATGPLIAANNATREAAVRFIQRDIDCGGGTNLAAGLQVAQQMQTGSIALITDGDLNSPEFQLVDQEKTIFGGKSRGPVLSIIGIGPRPHTGAQETLRSLAEQQDGTCETEQFAGETDLLTSSVSPGRPVSATP